MRLTKILAHMGYASRRTIESWLMDGKISCNGKIAGVGQKVSAGDIIKIANKTLCVPDVLNSKTRVLMYCKPLGEICTRKDPKGRKSVFDQLPRLEGRWVSIGRLDVQTGGLLLFTNNGDLASKLMHPSYEVERTYLVRFYGTLGESEKAALLSGILLDGKTAAFKSLEKISPGKNELGKNKWAKVSLCEGKYHEVRRLFASQGLFVNQLKRISFGPIILGTLRPGAFRFLSPQLCQALEQAVQWK